LGVEFESEDEAKKLEAETTPLKMVAGKQPHS
jgi:hypothetical protein